MIHNLKPYPAYKDSGVSWLGEVPAHWEVTSGAKLLFRDWSIPGRETRNASTNRFGIERGVVDRELLPM